MAEVTIKINDKEISVPNHMTILEAARLVM
jgi:NADH dehydrogenase/NADH:ubiquinone oxidoreductase subunit G